VQKSGKLIKNFAAENSNLVSASQHKDELKAKVQK
jgi:hypothetical protein